MTNKKLPKNGTRVRSVLDKLYHSKEDGEGSVSWSALRDAYVAQTDKRGPGNRKYAGLSLSRVLQKYAVRLRPGQYHLKYEWFEFMKKALNEFKEKNMAPDDGTALDTLCANCNERYGAHYGKVCPEVDASGNRRCPKGPPAKYWCAPKPPTAKDADPRKWEAGDKLEVVSDIFRTYSIPKGSKVTFVRYGAGRVTPQEDFVYIKEVAGGWNLDRFKWIGKEVPAGVDPKDPDTWRAGDIVEFTDKGYMHFVSNGLSVGTRLVFKEYRPTHRGDSSSKYVDVELPPGTNPAVSAFGHGASSFKWIERPMKIQDKKMEENVEKEWAIGDRLKVVNPSVFSEMRVGDVVELCEISPFDEVYVKYGDGQRRGSFMQSRFERVPRETPLSARPGVPAAKSPADWKKGDLLRYKGGYGHFDYRGFKKGDLVEFLEMRDGFVCLTGEDPGHGTSYFEWVGPKKDERILTPLTEQNLSTLLGNNCTRLNYAYPWQVGEFKRKIESLELQLKRAADERDLASARAKELEQRVAKLGGQLARVRDAVRD